MKCRFCDSDVTLFLDMSYIPISVTSDCKVIHHGIKVFKCNECGLIQKESSEELQQNYFDKFFSYNLSDGEEQVKFVNGVAFPRSELIINSIKEYIDVKGTLLDIGTGNGAFLKSFKNSFNQWKLYGQDIQDNSQEQILSIINKDNLYIKDISDINNKFDLISIIHVLGHIPLLNKFLNDLIKIQKENGKIIFQTPDLINGFFDIVVIDQINHFSIASLQNIISSKFHNICFFDSIDKELTLCINIKSDKLKKDKEDVLLNNMSNRFKQFIDYLYNSNCKYVVLGCSPASTYIGAILNENLKYFVDEDINKIGKIHLNKQIKYLKDVDKDDIIVLPFLQDNIINNIKSRNKSFRFFSYMDV